MSNAKLAGPLPTFLIVGAQKCGTTTLHDVLSQHPEISVSHKKEINFFTLPQNYKKGLDFYRSFFSENKNTKSIGEASPGYLCYPDVHKKIYKDLGQIKIVIIIRDPIKRAYSQYWDNRRKLKEKYTEQEIIHNYLEVEFNPKSLGYFSRGVYYPDVKKYMDQFGRDNVKIIILEELIKSQKLHLQNLYRFLNVNQNKGLQKLPAPSNASKIWLNPFYNYFLRHPKATPFLPPKFRRLLLYGKKSNFKYPLPKGRSLKKLISFYGPWNNKLEEVLGMDLKYWHK